MFRLITTNTFEKDVMRCAKRGFSLDLLQKVIKLLENSGTHSDLFK